MLERQKLSVVIITKNAAEVLSECLASVMWADEIILLDYSSQDKTQQIAHQYGAKVFNTENWLGYGKQRQLAQDHANYDMILMVDADERVTLELRVSIEKVLSQPAKKNIVYSVNRRNFFLGRFMRHSGWYPDRVFRLYPRSYRYNDNLVHESLNVQNARTIRLTGELLHITCDNFIDFQKKQLSYAEAWAKQHYKKGKNCTIFSIFIHTLGAFFKTLVLRAGFLDGHRGWLLATVNTHYTFSKYTALWAINQTKKKKN